MADPTSSVPPVGLDADRLVKLLNDAADDAGGIGEPADSLRALAEALPSLLLAREERDEARNALAEAAREIPCAGPVAHRIRVMRQEWSEALRLAREERDALIEGKVCQVVNPESRDCGKWRAPHRDPSKLGVETFATADEALSAYFSETGDAK